MPTGYNSIVYSDNWKLSLARADETFNYILSQGISAEKIIAVGYAGYLMYENYRDGQPAAAKKIGSICHNLLGSQCGSG